MCPQSVLRSDPHKSSPGPNIKDFPLTWRQWPATVSHWFKVFFTLFAVHRLFCLQLPPKYQRWPAHDDKYFLNSEINLTFLNLSSQQICISFIQLLPTPLCLSFSHQHWHRTRLFVSANTNYVYSILSCRAGKRDLIGLIGETLNTF